MRENETILTIPEFIRNPQLPLDLPSEISMVRESIAAGREVWVRESVFFANEEELRQNMGLIKVYRDPVAPKQKGLDSRYKVLSDKIIQLVDSDTDLD